jgi:hypothetical protein
VKVPPEFVASLRNSAPHGIRDAGATRELWLINSAYAAGADQELEAVEHWLITGPYGASIALSAPTLVGDLRATRRPKPPSLAEQALEELESIHGDAYSVGMGFDAPAIRTALNRLAELEAHQ